MKKLTISILLLLLVLTVSAQNYTIYNPQPREDKIPQWVKVVTIYSTSIILDAVADGMRDDGNKPLSHTLEAASVGVLLASPFIIDYDKSKWGWYLASYVTLRVSLFDPAYNISRGLPINYCGTTSGWDKARSGMPNGFQTYARGVSFLVGVAIPINELNHKK